uniref:Uncharacterized protein n=1 Tax=Timema tahoe TaxID=61484 RepID=A0A7R9FHE6_9NEOP|nr:unnamed protein product [Timema tahoe]
MSTTRLCNRIDLECVVGAGDRPVSGGRSGGGERRPDPVRESEERPNHDGLHNEDDIYHPELRRMWRLERQHICKALWMSELFDSCHVTATVAHPEIHTLD